LSPANTNSWLSFERITCHRIMITDHGLRKRSQQMSVSRISRIRNPRLLPRSQRLNPQKKSKWRRTTRAHRRRPSHHQHRAQLNEKVLLRVCIFVNVFLECALDQTQGAEKALSPANTKSWLSFERRACHRIMITNHELRKRSQPLRLRWPRLQRSAPTRLGTLLFARVCAARTCPYVFLSSDFSPRIHLQQVGFLNTAPAKHRYPTRSMRHGDDI
jgi:hypothetical protein